MTTHYTLKVRWFLPKGFYVRRISRTGHVTGHLTDVGGFGGTHIAQRFQTESEAVAAAEKAKVRHCQVLENIGAAMK